MSGPTINPVSSQAPNKPMSVTGTTDPNGHVIVSTDWGHSHGADADPQGRWGATFQAPMDPGTHNVTVTQRSTDGSEVSTGTAFTVRNE